RRIRIERAHMEEDTGKTSHMGGDGRISGATHSLVDYNRAGVPLVEIVSAPDLRSAADARAYVSELRSILVATGASDGKMEEGSLRVDANVSMRRAGETEFGTRCEIKNMNSLRSLGRAIEYEAARQAELLQGGEAIAQQTRHWDEAAGVTSAMRSKEEAYDYRYFPEPDLVPLVPDEAFQQRSLVDLGPMPAERRALVTATLRGDGDTAGLDHKTRSQVATVVDLGLDQLVLDATAAGADARVTLNRAANEAAANADGASRLEPKQFAALVNMEVSGALSPTQAKDVLSVMLESGGDPADIARARGFEALSDASLDDAVAAVIAAHPSEWERFRTGEAQVTGFLVGQVMKATSGRANGKLVNEALRREAGGAVA
ncbi:MAG: Asp-tRNA(Asn)/Glu-tRNA(Gln) amidotransferase subunit GatB, partial [Acidimicrobiales bacterium]